MFFNSLFFDVIHKDGKMLFWFDPEESIILNAVFRAAHFFILSTGEGCSFRTNSSFNTYLCAFNIGF